MHAAPLEQFAHFMLAVFAERFPHIVQVFVVHADQKIVCVVIASYDPPRCTRLMRHTHIVELFSRAAVNIVSDFFAARRRRFDNEIAFPSRLPYQIFHDEFRHRRAADVSVTDK